MKRPHPLIILAGIGFLSFLILAGLMKTGEAQSGWSADKEAALKQLSETLQGTVAYERPDGIYTSEIGSTESTLIAKGGQWPRWSADGRWIAFVRGPAVLRITKDGSKEEALAEAAKPRAVAYHPNGREILFTDGNSIRSVDIASRAVREVASGHKFRELDISADGTRLIASRKVFGGTDTLAYEGGKEWKLTRGCSASFSPDASAVTNNSGSHRSLHILNWPDGRSTKEITAPARRTFDNQFWSNHPDWITAVTDDGKQDVLLLQVSSGNAVQVTKSGDCNRPDLFVKPST